MQRRPNTLTPSLAEGRTIVRRVVKLAKTRANELAYQKRVLRPVRRRALDLVQQLNRTLRDLLKKEQGRPTSLAEFSGDRFGELRDQVETHLVRLGVLLAYEIQLAPSGPGRPIDVATLATEALSLSGMRARRIVSVLQSQGLEGAGNAEGRVRQRRKRQGGPNSPLFKLLPNRTSSEVLRTVFDGEGKPK
jgi:hypothetical protein